jgi:hypothetical protein
LNPPRPLSLCADTVGVFNCRFAKAFGSYKAIEGGLVHSTLASLTGGAAVKV